MPEPCPVDNRTFRTMIERLTEGAPIPHRGVKVRRVSRPVVQLEPVYGRTKSTRRGWLITISAGLSYAETLDTLIHEWAHAASGDLDHTARWGAAYARAYRGYHGTA